MTHLPFEPVIGLEVHCQLKTATKIFCGCATSYGGLPNHQTCPVCLGLPGALPVPNTKAIEYAVRMGLAVGGRISRTSTFARKQYFYPDLPKGYQLTQHTDPYCVGGSITLDADRSIPLTRIHLEEDAGKSVHEGVSSYVDLNRAGVPLIEIVSEPEIYCAEDAVLYLRKLHAIVRHLDISDGNMEEGSFRCDVNISLRKKGDATLGTRTEIKNLNSFRHVEKAIQYEILRQSDLLLAGERVPQETRLFDAASGKTQPMRSKEDAHDYRYFSDPDLLPVVLSEERIERIRKQMPELPDQKAERFVASFDLPRSDALQLTVDRDLAEYFEKICMLSKQYCTPKVVANWVLSEFLREANERDWKMSHPMPITAEHFAELMKLICDETISGKLGKSVFRRMAAGERSPAEIVKLSGLAQISDLAEIKVLVEQVLDAHPEQTNQFLLGKEQVFGFLIGISMKKSAGKINPGLLNQVLKEQLDARRKSPSQ